MSIIQSTVRQPFLFILLFFIAGLFIVFFLIMPSYEKLPEVETVTKVFYVDNVSAAHKEIIDRFNKAYSGNIEIVPINLPFSKFSTNERKELLTRALRSKSNQIDLFTVDVIWVPRFARWCQPLDEYFPVNERSKFVKSVLNSCYYDNHFYAIPLYTDISVMYYRSDIINRLPGAEEIEKKISRSLTWQEFIDLHKRLKENGLNYPFYVFSADHFEGLTCSFYEGIAGLKSKVITKDSVNLNSPEVKKTIQLLSDLVNKYKMSPPEVIKFDDYQGYQYALKNDAVFIRGWPGFLTQYNTVLDNAQKMKNIKMAPLPHMAGYPPKFVYGGWNFMISKYSEKKKEALSFIRFALREENQKILFKIGGYIPVNKDVYKDTLFMTENNELNNYLKFMENGFHRPYRKNYTRISDIISYYLQKAIQNQTSVEEVINSMQRAINSDETVIK